MASAEAPDWWIICFYFDDSTLWWKQGPIFDKNKRGNHFSVPWMGLAVSVSVDGWVYTNSVNTCHACHDLFPNTLSCSDVLAHMGWMKHVIVTPQTTKIAVFYYFMCTLILILVFFLCFSVLRCVNSLITKVTFVPSNFCSWDFLSFEWCKLIKKIKKKVFFSYIWFIYFYCC